MVLFKCFVWFFFFFFFGMGFKVFFVKGVCVCVCVQVVFFLWVLFRGCFNVCFVGCCFFLCFLVAVFFRGVWSKGREGEKAEVAEVEGGGVGLGEVGRGWSEGWLIVGFVSGFCFLVFASRVCF